MSDINIYEAAYDAAEAECKALRAERDRLRGDCDRLRASLHAAATRAVEAEAERDRLREALEEAREDVVHWAGYASDYFKEKHDLAGDLARIDAALAKEAGQ
jgi:chromosome segregation ATPase